MTIELVNPRMIGPIPLFTGEVAGSTRVVVVLDDGTWVYVPVANLPGGGDVGIGLDCGELFGDGPTGASFEGGEIGGSDGESFDGGEIR